MNDFVFLFDPPQVINSFTFRGKNTDPVQYEISTPSINLMGSSNSKSRLANLFSNHLLTGESFCYF